MTAAAIQGRVMLPDISPLIWSESGHQLDASGEKHQMIVQVPKDGNVTDIGFRTRAVNTSQTLKVSLQSVDTTTGNADGTILGSGNAYGTQASPSANTFYEVTLTSALAVTQGDRIAVVVEFDSTVGDLFIGYGTTIGGGEWGNYTGLYTGSWSKTASTPFTLFKYDDGSYGSGFFTPYDGQVTTTYHINSTNDEIGNRIVLDFPITLRGFWGYINLSGDAEYRIYNSSDTEVASIAMDSNIRISNARNLHRIILASDVALAAGTYRVVLAPTTTTSVIMHGQNVHNAASMDTLSMGQDCYATARADAGSFTDTTTRRYLIGLLANAFDDGAGGGGGLITHPGMTGGMRG